MFPWNANKPICDITKECYVAHPSPGVGACVTQHEYTGDGLERVELQSTIAQSDAPISLGRRFSTDDGKTWSNFEPTEPLTTFDGETKFYWGLGPCADDPASGKKVGIWLHQAQIGDIPYDHLFWASSDDHGRTWGKPTLLRYEDGADLDPADPLREDYLHRNGAYFGSNLIVCRDGTLVHPAVISIPLDQLPDGNPKGIATWDQPADSPIRGCHCFLGRWNAAKQTYEWSAGQPVWVPRHVSSRGLMEPEPAKLTDGRILIVWRLSNLGLAPADQPGRKLFSVSTDGGQTLRPPAELTYDDGTRFYSSSSFLRMHRHSQTGKLYWIGNLAEGPTDGNDPRYPLVIAEVDETLPALKKDTVTLIDTRGPDDGEQLQLSNFIVVENRRTHDLEIFLTRLGSDANDFWGGDVFRYTLRLAHTP